MFIDEVGGDLFGFDFFCGELFEVGTNIVHEELGEVAFIGTAYFFGIGGGFGGIEESFVELAMELSCRGDDDAACGEKERDEQTC